MIYVGSADGVLRAINPDGTLKWEFPTGGNVGCSPAIGLDGAIYVGSDSGWFYAINPDGTKRWEQWVGGSIRQAPAIALDETVYFTSGDSLYAINRDGTNMRKFGAALEYSPAIGYGGTVFIGSSSVAPPDLSSSSGFCAINPDGSKKWCISGLSVSFTGYANSPAIGPDGTIYAGSGDGRLYAIEANGAIKWSFQTYSGVTTSPAISSDGTIFVGSGDGRLYAINPNGTQRWVLQTGLRINSSPTIGSDGTVYVGSDDGRLYAIIGGSGSLAISPWSEFHHDLRNTGRSQPLLDSDQDGLPDSLESATCTNPFDADTDDDGIPDGVEDANHDGVVDDGETNPCNVDTDGDGIQDGTELGKTAGVADPDGDGPLLGTNMTTFIPDADPTTTTDPLNPDSDGDGILDGVEDANHNGRVDIGERDPGRPNKPMPWLPLLLGD